jgi:hypothetical protein
MKERIMSLRKIPLAASQHGIPKEKGSLTKLIKITGIPGLPILELSGRRKLNLEIRTRSGEELLGHLELGAISRWRGVDDLGRGREIYWEKLKGWGRSLSPIQKASLT